MDIRKVTGTLNKPWEFIAGEFNDGDEIYWTGESGGTSGTWGISGGQFTRQHDFYGISARNTQEETILKSGITYDIEFKVDSRVDYKISIGSVGTPGDEDDSNFSTTGIISFEWTPTTDGFFTMLLQNFDNSVYPPGGLNEDAIIILDYIRITPQ